MTHIDILFLTAAGPGFLLLGIWNLKRRAWRDGIPAGFGAEPPSRNSWPRRFSLLSAMMLILIGAFISLAFAALLYSQFVPE
jgi:hypothetical protein